MLLFNFQYFIFTLSTFYAFYTIHSVEWPFNDILFSEYCQGTEYVNGKWIYTYDDSLNIEPQANKKKSFVCCGWDTRDWADSALTNSCYPELFYHEEYTGNDNTNHLNLMHIGGHACTCDEIRKTRLTVSAREKWDWKPTNCKLRPWNATQFCEVLGERKILLVGDSTMQQTAGTLMAMIQSYVPRPLCSSHIIFGRSDQLFYEDIKSYVDKYNPDFTIISAGPHYYLPTLYYDTMHSTLNYIRYYQNQTYEINDKSDNTEREDLAARFVTSVAEKRKPSNRFIWKTINPAHTNCDNFPNATQFYFPPSKDDPFAWAHFHLYDKIMLKMTKEYDLDVIDMRPLYFRPDGHPGRDAWEWVRKSGGDCLHYCTPGPVDLFSVLMLNYLVNDKEL
jgi:hypothetical protein